MTASIFVVWQMRNEVIFKNLQPDIQRHTQQVIFFLKIQLSRVDKMKDTGTNRSWCARFNIYPKFIPWCRKLLIYYRMVEISACINNSNFCENKSDQPSLS